ncbi:Bug family tripartite tricarboxylate transporter substrate binding protein [Amorphus sp. 3PC139-8]|uniref:Bug family tripartite tricarboxylate transporter substrate binding protein n=1 Tax=Amorphus sp. 3PC139-8 TaxID=2735676 RepID=UPI00345DAEE7
MKRLLLVAAGVCALAIPAQAFPDKPIELVVPFSPGGGSDVSARIFAGCLEDKLPVKVLVKNITGARGKIAEVEVRDARPDGTKLLWAHQGMDMAKPTGRSDYNYTAFAPVASSVVMNYGIFSGKGSGIDSVETLTEKVKANPGEVTVGTALNGFSHFAVLDFMDAAGLSVDELKTIPMSGDKTRIVATIQGNLTLVPTAVGAAAPYVDSGDIVSVAVLSDKRDPRLKDAETAEEQGVDATFAMYFTTFAPKNTPQDRIDILADAWMEAAKDPACVAKLSKQSMTVDAARGEELDQDLAKRYDRIVTLTNKFNLKSD